MSSSDNSSVSVSVTPQPATTQSLPLENFDKSKSCSARHTLYTSSLNKIFSFVFSNAISYPSLTSLELYFSCPPTYFSLEPTLTLYRANPVIPTTQCAAVRMYLSLITEPPQNCQSPELYSLMRAAANGNSWSSAFSPPIILWCTLVRDFPQVVSLALSSVLSPLSSVLSPLSSVLSPLSSVLSPLSSVLSPLSPVLCAVKV